jgi:transposase
MTDTTPRRPYRTDLTDAQWALIAPALTGWREQRTTRGLGIHPPTAELREVFNALIYLDRTGCQWDLLPHDFPPWQTVYGYFADWRDEGIFTQLNIDLVGLTRTDAGRADGPTLAILDSQSIKTSTSVPLSDQGADANKKLTGRKRHIAVDILGLLLALLVTGANVSDTYGGRKLLDNVHAAYPTVRTALVDGGYQDSLPAYGAKLGITVIKVMRNPEAKGFEVIPKRWIVERTFGWHMFHRRLVRDFENRPDSSSSMIRIAMIDNMLHRITHQNTPSWHYLPELALAT